jgi:RND family efflux transporter MFP subunit
MKSMNKKEPEMSNHRVTRLLIAGLFLAGFGAMAGCGGDRKAHPAAQDSSPTVAAQTAVAEWSSLFVRLDVTGSAAPYRRVSPGTKLLGRIIRVPVQEGDRVTKGQVLAELESRDLAAGVDQAKAALAMAKANRSNARAQFDRMADLHARGSVTDKNLEDAEAGIRVADAAVAQAMAAQEAAEVTFSYAAVRSPLTGWVTKRMVEAGDMAAPGQPMFVLEDLSKIKVNLQVPERHVVGISKTSAVEIVFDVLEESFDAVVDNVVPSADSTSRTYQVQVILDNRSGVIKAGMFARATFEGEPRQALVVQASSVISRGQLTGLFILNDADVARLRWVRTGPVSERGIEILSGLNAGERYVSDPPPALVDGARVEAK